MSIYDLQGLENDAETAMIQASSPSVSCWNPSPAPSTVSIGCWDW
ncbi:MULTISPECIES: SapB/AmfS family lanthipeptide [unclassified Streptomyces]